MKITEPRELLGKVVWCPEIKVGSLVATIQYANHIFNNPKWYRYVCSMKLETIESKEGQEND